MPPPPSRMVENYSVITNLLISSHILYNKFQSFSVLQFQHTYGILKLASMHRGATFKEEKARFQVTLLV